MPDGAIADLSFALQTAKGSPAAAPTYKCFFAGGDIGPYRRVGLLSTTDAHGFPTRASYAERFVQGEVEIFARPEPLGLLAYAALGAKAVSGAGPFTHTFTSAATRPWVTFWRAVGNGTVIEQYIDCRVSKLRIISRYGEPVRLAFEVRGRLARRRTANPGLAATVTDPFMHHHGKGTMTVDGAVISTIREIDVEVDNRDTARPGPLGTGWDVVGGGERYGNVLLTGRIANAARYDLFHYGSTSPADATDSTLEPSTGSVDFRWVQSASRELRVDCAAMTPASFVGFAPNVSHDPMVETRAYQARFGGATSAVRIRLINGVASY